MILGHNKNENNYPHHIHHNVYIQNEKGGQIYSLSILSLCGIRDYIHSMVENQFQRQK